MKQRAQKRRYAKKRKSPYHNSKIKTIQNGGSSSSQSNIEFEIESTRELPVQQTVKEAPGNAKVLKPLLNRSKEKLQNSVFSSKNSNRITRNQSLKLGIRKDTCISKASGFKIMNFDLLNAFIVENVVCKRCKKGKLSFEEDPSKKKGLAEKLMMTCSNCKHTSSFYTSPQSSSSTSKSFDINVRSVFASQPIGHTGLKKFCANMGLVQPIHKTPYNTIQKKLSSTSVEQAEKIMCEAADRLRTIVLEEHADNIEVFENGNLIAKVAVTVDGTWQRRGHCSKIGVVFVLAAAQVKF